MKVLGIETSCDNTALAVMHISKNILFSNNYHQDTIMRKYGGYVPHILGCYQSYNIVYALSELKESFNIHDIDYISVTVGPGMMFSLSIGYKIAHILCELTNKPIFYCDHIEAHILSVFIEHNICFPYLCVVISGGHCLFVKVKSLGVYEILGQTVDDSPGEVFDKVAKELNLEVYNGYYISMMAKNGVLINELSSVRVNIKNNIFCCSFSGFKTRIIRAIKSNKYTKQDIAYTTQYLIISHILLTTNKIYMSYCKDMTVVFVGGVSANEYLRQQAYKYFHSVIFTSIKYAADNAEMIANVCLMYKKKDMSYNSSSMCYSKTPYDMVVFKKSSGGV